MQKLTALILSYNEEANLPDCLQSVQWADEIFVVDSFSTDRSVEIAESFGARVAQHEYLNNAAQKNWAIPQCSHEWIVIVEADERMTPELRQEIEQLFEQPMQHDAYFVYRRNFVFGREVRHGGWDRDKAARLIHRHCRYGERQLAAEVVLDKPAGWLRGRMPHYPYREFDQLYAKFQRYTSWGAIELNKQGVRANWVKILLHPLWGFFKQYVLRRGFLDGYIGLILAGQTASYIFTKYAKLWYIQQIEEKVVR
ncbi:MAG: glycosyltransferase family 2 protein [Candidatus Hinthialibacter antarcticus]|nr:glycosyltransferase family 2 protein [Candidatus Hinthialibacter antarcticus]